MIYWQKLSTAFPSLRASTVAVALHVLKRPALTMQGQEALLRHHEMLADHRIRQFLALKLLACACSPVCDQMLAWTRWRATGQPGTHYPGCQIWACSITPIAFRNKHVGICTRPAAEKEQQLRELMQKQENSKQEQKNRALLREAEKTDRETRRLNRPIAERTGTLINSGTWDPTLTEKCIGKLLGNAELKPGVTATFPIKQSCNAIFPAQ